MAPLPQTGEPEKDSHMVIKYNSDIISGGIFLAVAGILYLLIPSQIQTMETTAVTAQTIPKIVTAGLGLFSFCLLLQGVFKTPRKTFHFTSEVFRSGAFKKEMRSVLFAFLFIIYAILMTFTGYVLSTAFLAVAILLYYGARKWYYYGISLMTIGIVYFVFALLLDVNLP